MLEAINNPEDENAGVRYVPFSRELYIEFDDFMEDPPKKYFRLAPGREVRLRYAYFITCTKVIKNDLGEVTELRCVYDPATKGGNAPDGRKVKSTLHWVSAQHAIESEVRLYEKLFSVREPSKESNILEHLNPNSLEIIGHCKIEPELAASKLGEVVQFERLGYFCVDNDTCDALPVFNRTIPLRDTWAKVQNKG
jgi:glutaminyl-tRNA synthetase